MTRSTPEIYLAPSLAAAVDALAEHGSAGAPFAGGTWIMRSPIRREAFKSAYVGLGRIDGLKMVEATAETVEIGSGVTHAGLAQAVASLPDLAALAIAAGQSANPAVRETATVGGNLACTDFAAADLVPALLALGADVEMASRDGVERISLETYLERRRGLEPGRLVTKVILKRSGGRSAHARLPLRKAGDYPVAVVSLGVALSADERIETVRIAVGSVEPVARRWTRLEEALIGRRLQPDDMAETAKAHTAAFSGRDGVEAPGWYRVSVLPALVARATATLLDAVR